MKDHPESPARVAGVEDLEAAGGLLCDFNREFDEPTPPAPVLTDRLRQLIEYGDTLVIVAGDVPAAVAVLRFRPALWSTALECYLAELYVKPARRGQGLGRAMMETAIDRARERGAQSMEIGVDEPDTAARRLYESLGFSNRVGGEGGPVMFVYERDL